MLPLSWSLLLLVFALIVLLAVISVIDIQTLTIPNSLNAALAVAGLGFQLGFAPVTSMAPIAGALLLVAIFFLVRALYRRMRGTVGLGLGDVKMAGASALWLQPASLPIFVFVSSATALTFLLFFGKRDVRYGMTGRLPFGPFLALGLLVTWCLETFTDIGLLV